MRQISPIADHQRQSRSQNLFWVIELSVANHSFYLANRPLSIEEIQFSPILLDLKLNFNPFPYSLIPAAGRHLSSAAEIKLTRASTTANLLIDSLRQGELLGNSCHIGLFLKPPAQTPSFSDIIWLGWFAIVSGAEDRTSFTLQLSDILSASYERGAGRVLAKDMAGDIPSASLGRTIPFIFGHAEETELLPFRLGVKASLQKDLLPDDNLIYVISVTGFPSSGVVQVGNELITYMDIDSQANTLGTPATPVVREQPAFHSAGLLVFLVPDGGFEFLVADHPCRTVTNLRTKKWLIPPTRYSVQTGVIAGYEVTKVLFSQLPVLSQSDVNSTLLEITPANFPGSWSVGTQNNALDPFKIIDTEEWASAAIIDQQHNLLQIKFSGDLTRGETRYGLLQKVRLCLQFFADQRWTPTTAVKVRLKKNSANTQGNLRRPLSAELGARTSSHTHTDSIGLEISDTRPLFSLGKNKLVVKFDEVQGEEFLGAENYYWRDSWRAKDDDFSTGVLNFSGPSVSECKAPVKFFLKRISLNSQAVKIQRINFCVQLDTANSDPKYVSLSALIAGKFSGSGSFWATPASARFIYSIDNSGGLITPDDLTAQGSNFSVTVPDGRLIRLYEAWLELEYQWNLPGQQARLTARRSGQISLASPLEVQLPVSSRWQEFDFSQFVLTNGGWQFFNSQEPAIIEVEFNGADDATRIYLQQVKFILEYRLPTGEEVSEQIFATVDGLVSSKNELLTNPADIIYYLLTDERFLGINPERLDEQSFSQAKNWFSSQGFKFSFSLRDKTNCGSLLSSALEECGALLSSSSRKIKLLLLAEDLGIAFSSFSCSMNNILDRKIALRHSATDQIINSLRLYYGNNEHKKMLILKDGISQQLYGIYEYDWQLKWHSTDSQGVLDLGALVLRQRAGHNLLLALSEPLIVSHLEPGDKVNVDLPYYFTLTQSGRATLIRLENTSSWQLHILCPPIGWVCWSFDQLTFIRHLPGNMDKEFVIAGRSVARLNFQGNLRIKGEGQAFTLGEKYLAEPIYFDQQSENVYFGYKVANNLYRGCFAFTNEGDLLVLGSIAEHSRPAQAYLNGCYESTEEFFAISIDGSQVLLVYDVLQGILCLSGELQEKTKF